KILIRERCSEKLKQSMASVVDKAVRAGFIDEAKKALQEAIDERAEDDPLKEVSSAQVAEYMEAYEAELMRAQVLDTGMRADGRRCHEIRPIAVAVGLLPRTHGTGLFTRGTTQVLSVATLGIGSDAQRLDSIDPQTEKRYMHHYNFPGFSVGEVKPMRGPG